MKTNYYPLLAAMLLLPLTITVRAQNTPAESVPVPVPSEEAQAAASVVDRAAAETAETAEPTEPAEPELAESELAPPPQNDRPVLATNPGSNDAELRLNFRNAPLDLVLDYLSEAAGFTIVLETKIKGSIDVWSNHPVTTQEAIDILDSALAKNGYAAIRNGKTLTIVSKESAKTRNIPIVQSTDWQTIPQTEVIATYIIPVRYINAAELVTSLAPLTPEKMQITANTGSNSLLITDTQASIRRIAHIASLLDSSVSSVSTMKIIPLKHSDAKAMAQTINDLYSASGSNTRNTTRGNTGRGNFPFPGAFGGRGGN